MSKTPHDILASALAGRGRPEHRRMELGPALSTWLAWAGSHACPTVEAAEAYLDGLIVAHGPAGAQSRFATFQVAAGYTLGPHATRHLVQVLRSRLVAEKPARLTGAAVFAAGLARLPDAWRPSFQAIIATQVAGFGDPGTVHWSEARIRSVMASLAVWHAFCEATGRSPAPSGTGFEAWAVALTAPGRDGGPVAATTVKSYLARVLDGYGSVIAPGFRSTACRLMIDDWAPEPTRNRRAATRPPATSAPRRSTASVSRWWRKPWPHLSLASRAPGPAGTGFCSPPAPACPNAPVRFPGSPSARRCF